jgi:hypothetical protein
MKKPAETLVEGDELKNDGSHFDGDYSGNLDEDDAGSLQDKDAGSCPAGE